MIEERKAKAGLTAEAQRMQRKPQRVEDRTVDTIHVLKSVKEC
jgi:hypothetical protein